MKGTELKYRVSLTREEWARIASHLADSDCRPLMVQIFVQTGIDAAHPTSEAVEKL